jgi:hypothetical protein
MKDKLVTKNYIEILAANFLLYFGFYLLMPVLPFYLAEIFNSEKGTIGIILSCYTIAALCIRPFSGYLLNSFARKPLFFFLRLPSADICWRAPSLYSHLSASSTA